MEGKPYSLPGTRFVQVNQHSNEGKCLYSAVGSAMQRPEVGLFSAKQRNLGCKIKTMTRQQLELDDTKQAMEQKHFFSPFADQKWGIATRDDLVRHLDENLHLGRSFELHLLARSLKDTYPDNNIRIVVHTKHTNDYVVYAPFVYPVPAMGDEAEKDTAKAGWRTVFQQYKLHPPQVLDTDLVVIHNIGSHHWSYAEFDKDKAIAERFEQNEKVGTAEEPIEVDEQNEKGGTAEEPIEIDH